MWRGTMADYRVWYASRDPYHCIFRMIRLLEAKGGPIPIEQLRILDMLLMFPSLLHRLTLPSALRERLRGLHVETPAKSFVHLPGTASVWQDLQIYQLTALKRLVGLGMLKRDDLRDSNASLDHSQTPTELLNHAIAQNEAASSLVQFLVNDIGTLPMTGSQGLVRRTGLPSRGPVT
jgi:hypothetical protein